MGDLGGRIRMATEMMTSQQEYQQTLLELLPDQGMVGEETYLWLTDHTTRLIEYTDGYIEVLPMPTDEHQGILAYLEDEVKACPQMRDGVVRFSPLRVRLRDGKIREPDLLLLLDRRDPRRSNRYWSGADLVMEVVSPDKPERDLVEKRRDYAEAGIPEYWIVNPLNRTITVLTLDGDAYREHGVFTLGMQATSVLLVGFALDVRAAFAAA
jgi:Uma2 family endonuclease